MLDDTLAARIPSLSADQLVREIEYHEQRYWVLQRPEISDEVYDLLVRRLEELDPQSPVLHRVAPTGLAHGDKVQHPVPMLSLDKCYGAEDFHAWLRMVEGALGMPKGALAQAPVVVTPKIDGVAATLRYDPSGRLTLAATRGSGTVGEDITTNVLQIPGIPLRLPFGPAEVRGEVHMKRSVFSARYGAQFANPRNLSAGLLKQKEGSREAVADLAFFAYELFGAQAISESAKLAALAEAGFTPPPFEVLPADQVPARYEAALKDRDSWDFDADGIVIRLDRSDLVEAAGVTAHHPRGAVAFKFQGETGFSRLQAVEWSVSRTGRISPVAIVEPVFLSGANVARCSLHNIRILRDHGLALGDRVQVTRRGGVIPNLEATLGGGHSPVQVPSHCPSCQREALLLAPVLLIGGERLPLGATAQDAALLHQEFAARLAAKSAARTTDLVGTLLASLRKTPKPGDDEAQEDLLTWRVRSGQDKEARVRHILEALPRLGTPGAPVPLLLAFCPQSPASHQTLALALDLLVDLPAQLFLLPVLRPHLEATAQGDDLLADLLEASALGGAPDWLLEAAHRDLPPGLRAHPGALHLLDPADLPDLALAACDGNLACSRPTECPDTLVGGLVHFARVLGMKGFGPEVVRLLQQHRLLKTPADFFVLPREAIASIPGLGALSADNLLAQVEAARRPTLAQFLAALGIEDLADSVSTQLAQEFGTLEAVRALDIPTICKLEGQSFATAFKVVSGLRRAAPQVDALLPHLALRSAAPATPTDGPLLGLSFVFTGALAALTRKEAQDRVRALGAATPADVSKDTTHLVLGTEEGGRESSKLKKARKLNASGANVALIGEEEFLRLLRSA